ncbi:MAG: hypothetical protein NTW11_03665 [Candidatus Staskawiczbacteria bacterium]|nr:hypothetical protein [Candidatus Staskawiczbacteria bacterium]
MSLRAGLNVIMREDALIYQPQGDNLIAKKVYARNAGITTGNEEPAILQTGELVPGITINFYTKKGHRESITVPLSAVKLLIT